MKTVLVLGFFWGLVSASCARTSWEATEGGHWYLQGEGGIGFPVSSQETLLYNPGYSSEIQVGYELNKDFALGWDGRLDFLPLNQQQAILMVEQYYGITGVTGTTTAGFTHFSMDLVLRYTPPLFKGVYPYIFCGAGIAFDTLGGDYSVTWNGGSQTGAFTPQSWTNFELLPGLGISFPLSNRLDVFVEGKMVLDFSPTDGSNPESNETPIVGIPVQAGLHLILP